MATKEEENLQKFAEQIAEAKAALEAKEGKKEEAPEMAAESGVDKETPEDPYLKEAISMGYNPDYQGANKKTPEQFVKDGSFFKKIDSLNKKIDTFETLVKDLTEANKRVAEENYKKGLQDALKERMEAVQAGDVEAFTKAEQKIQQAQQQAPKVQQAAMSEAEKAWVEENKEWFNQSTKENQEMSLLAIEYGKLIEARNPGIGQKELLKEMTDTIKALPRYAHRFKEVKKETAPAVGKSTVSGTHSKPSASGLVARLTAQQRSMYDQMVRSKNTNFTIEAYAKALDAAGRLENK